MENIKVTIASPWEADYSTATKELTLKGVEVTGRPFEIRFSDVQTRVLCELLGDAIQINKGLLGSPAEPVVKH